MIEPVLILIAVAAIGGAVRSTIGYSQKSDPGEEFNLAKFASSVVRGGIAGAAIVYMVVQPEVYTTSTYITAFFTAIGADVLIKEGYGAVQKMTE